MISNKLFVAVLCLTFISQSYEYYTTGECIKSPIIKDFSAEKYSGSWYELERAGVVFEYILKCVVAEYGFVNATTLTVKNTGLTLIGDKTFNVTGTGYSRKEQPNGLDVVFDNGNVGDYNVWETDYKTYALVYACKQVSFIPSIQMKQENVWILSRGLELDADLVAGLKGKLVASGIDPKKLSVVDQSCY